VFAERLKGKAPDDAVYGGIRHVAGCPGSPGLRRLKHDRIGNNHDTPVAKETCALVERLPMIPDVMETPSEQDHVK
jgi:hypothetical protein